MNRGALASILAAALVVGTILSLALMSCATAGFYDKSDSGVTKVCPQGPLVFCDAGTTDGRACVVSSNETDSRLKLMKMNLATQRFKGNREVRLLKFSTNQMF